MRKTFRLKPLFAAVTLAGMAMPALAERQQSIQPALQYVNGNGYFKYNGEDITREAAHYPIIMAVARFFYERSDGAHPFTMIHDLNPDTRLLIYENGPHARNDTYERSPSVLNGIGRWHDGRGITDGAGNPLGSIWDDHGPCATNDTWFLTTSTFVASTNANCHLNLLPSYNPKNEAANGNLQSDDITYWLDFGRTDVQEYWVRAVVNDMFEKADFWEASGTSTIPPTPNPVDSVAVGSTRPWLANGLFVDVAALTDELHVGSKYNPTQWATAAQSFIANVTTAIRSDYPDQDLYYNAGGSGTTEGAAAWAYLDGLSSASRPTGLLEEDGFVVAYSAAQAQFWPADKWLKQVNTLRATSHLNAINESHVDLLPDGPSGKDLSGHDVTYWDAFWYAMTSYLLGKNEEAGNSYFSFFIKSEAAGWLDARYRDENDLDIGKAVGNYSSQTVAATSGSTPSTATIYKREYEKGWVFVNPYPVNTVAFALPEVGKPIDHLTFQDPINVVNTNTLSLQANRGLVVLKDRLVGDWRFDASSGTSAADSHEYLPGDSMDGTVYGTGSPRWVAGIVDGAMQFNGTDDYVAVAHDTNRLVTAADDSLSISLWIDPDSGTTGANKATVMQFGTWQESGWQLWGGSGWNEFAFTAFTHGAEQEFHKPVQSPLPSGQWSHLTVTVENKASGNVKMYLNGQPFHSATLGNAFTSLSSDVLYMGAHKGGAVDATYWGGKLDNVKIQRKILTPYEVAAEYRAQVADWKLDEPQYRNKAFDNFGSAHGTLYGRPTWLGNGGSGAPAGAILFDGVDDAILVEHNIAQLATPTQLTVNAWVQPASDTASNIPLQLVADDGSAWTLYAGPGGNNIGIGLIDGTGSETFMAVTPTPVALSSSSWNKVSISVDNKAGGQVKLYVNDVAVPVQSTSTSSSTLSRHYAVSSGPVIMGASYGSGFWKGKLGHVQLFGRILSQSDIAQLTN